MFWPSTGGSGNFAPANRHAQTCCSACGKACVNLGAKPVFVTCNTLAWHSGAIPEACPPSGTQPILPNKTHSACAGSGEQRPLWPRQLGGHGEPFLSHAKQKHGQVPVFFWRAKAQCQRAGLQTRCLPIKPIDYVSFCRPLAAASLCAIRFHPWCYRGHA